MFDKNSWLPSLSSPKAFQIRMDLVIFCFYHLGKQQRVEVLLWWCRTALINRNLQRANERQGSFSQDFVYPLPSRFGPLVLWGRRGQRWTVGLEEKTLLLSTEGWRAKFYPTPGLFVKLSVCDSADKAGSRPPGQKGGEKTLWLSQVLDLVHSKALQLSTNALNTAVFHNDKSVKASSSLFRAKTPVGVNVFHLLVVFSFFFK